MNKKFLSLLFVLFFYNTWAQVPVSMSSTEKSMSLEECISYALQHNVSLKQTQLNVENEAVNVDIARQNKNPDLNGFFNINGNAGRNVDPFTNGIVTNTIGTNNLGLQANMPIYDAFRNKNTLERSKLTLEAAQLDVNAQKNAVALQVAVAYLNVLSTEDLITVSQKQLEVSNLQIDRIQKLIRAGSVPETNLYDLEAQLANDELSLINAQNNNESAKLTLKQAINMVGSEDIKVSRIAIPEPSLSVYPQQSQEVYETAINFMPEIKAGQIRIKAADRNIAIAKSLGMPTVSISSSWGTAYSSAAKKLSAGETKSQAIPVSAEFQGQTVPFVINFPQSSFNAAGIPYFNQLGTNQNFNVGVTARIPILNGYNQKYQTQASLIQKKLTETQNEASQLQIRQNIDQAYINMLNAQKRYVATQTQVKTLEKSFKASELRYNAGSGTFVDYNLAKSNLDRANANLIVSKYDYIFRIKILDFYQNKPLAF